MKFIFLNLKRFDIPPTRGGVNRISSVQNWGQHIIQSTIGSLEQFSPTEVKFAMFFPEAHLLSAVDASQGRDTIEIGCQSVYRADTKIGGNFGAFTTNRTANIAAELGCSCTIIGHCEERNDKGELLLAANVTDCSVVNKILNQQIKAAVEAGLHVLYCVGEKSEEQAQWKEVLGAQLDIGLAGVDLSKVSIAYEPVWSIGPGKTPADKGYITKVAGFIKEKLGDVAVVYGGGLKKDNAKMLSEIEEIDGGLIALTRFQGEIGFYPDEYIEIIKTYLAQ